MAYFRKFIKRDWNENGRFHVQLGTKYPVIYSTDSRCTDIRIENSNGTSTPVTPEALAEKPWILKNLLEEIAFQDRKETAILYQDINSARIEKRRHRRNNGYGY